MGVRIDQIKGLSNKGIKKSQSNWSDFLTKELGKKKAFGIKAKAKFFSELSILLNSGLDLKSTLEVIKEVKSKKKYLTILKSIEEQDKLTPELKKKIEECDNLTELEDIYLPYKPKKKTRASIARAKGLEPLAKIVMKQKEVDIFSKAAEFLNDEVENEDAALQGARDIIAEWVNENAKARNVIRKRKNWSCGKRLGELLSKEK